MQLQQDAQFIESNDRRMVQPAVQETLIRRFLLVRDRKNLLARTAAEYFFNKGNS